MSKILSTEDVKIINCELTQMRSCERIQDFINDVLSEYSSHNSHLKYALMDAIEAEHDILRFDEFLDVNDYSRVEDLPFKHESPAILYAYHVLWSIEDRVSSTQQHWKKGEDETTTFECLRGRKELDTICEWLIQQEWIAKISTENFYFLFSKQNYNTPPVKLSWLRQHGGGPNLRLLIKTLKLITKGTITDKDNFISKVLSLVVDSTGESLSGLNMSHSRLNGAVKKVSSVAPFAEFIESMDQGK